MSYEIDQLWNNVLSQKEKDNNKVLQLFDLIDESDSGELDTVSSDKFGARFTCEAPDSNALLFYASILVLEEDLNIQLPKKIKIHRKNQAKS